MIFLSGSSTIIVSRSCSLVIIVVRAGHYYFKNLQFQALRAMVQANPQILQVLVYIQFICLWCSHVGINTNFLIGIVFVANAARTREAKSTTSTLDSRTSGWLPTPNKWTCWGGGVRSFDSSNKICCFWIYEGFGAKDFKFPQYEVLPNSQLDLSRSSNHLIQHWCVRNILGQLAEAVPQAVTVTPEEREAIERVNSSSPIPYC